MRIKNAVAIGLCSFILYACNKTEVNNCVTDYGHPSAAEVANVKTYLTSKGIVADQDSAGFFYRIGFAGDGTDHPVLSDSVTIKYKGSLTDGTIFDSTATGETRKFPLGRLITGWQVGLPLLKKGGIIDLYLPPSHAYGCRGQYPIPANAITIFHIELVDF
jgi:FKBP-type peptidyl-prolyl cis-trans isomerase FkpA